jgi:hypothetical protein
MELIAIIYGGNIISLKSGMKGWSHNVPQRPNLTDYSLYFPLEYQALNAL